MFDIRSEPMSSTPTYYNHSVPTFIKIHVNRYRIRRVLTFLKFNQKYNNKIYYNAFIFKELILLNRYATILRSESYFT